MINEASSALPQACLGWGCVPCVVGHFHNYPMAYAMALKMRLSPLALEHNMSLSAFKSLLLLLAAALVTACGAGHGSSAPPPVGGLTLEAGEGGVTLSWTGVPGVDYWAYTGQSATLCKNCNNANDWYGNGVVGAQSRGWKPAISSPSFFTGNTFQTSLNNDVLYSFIMDGRINGGPGGEATPSKSAKPRLNGENWYANGSGIGTGGVTGLAFGPKLNPSNSTYDATGTYLALGSGGVKYQSANGLNWTQITTATATDTKNWKSATYAFRDTVIQKFVGVGAGGAVVYSTDLATFTSATSGSQDLNAVASNTSMVVAVGNLGTILRSTDGVNWTAAASVPNTTDLYAVTYATVAGGLWVAVGAGGKLWVSADASTWAEIESGTRQDLKGVASVMNATYPNGIYSPIVTPTYSYSVVAVGNAGVVTQSALGLSGWTPQTLGAGVNLNAIVASSALIPTNQFMAVGDGGTAFTSPDGVTWQARTPYPTPTINPKQDLIGLIRGYNNQYLAWAANGTTVYSK